MKCSQHCGMDRQNIFVCTFGVYLEIYYQVYSAKNTAIMRDLHDQPLKSQIRDNIIWLKSLQHNVS